MIISASRRTDIPAHYSEWFLNRLREGFALVPHPRNPKAWSRVTLSPETVDCIAFWTKNPEPMLGRLQNIEDFGYPFYFMFTLTPYDQSMEANLPLKNALLATFQKLSDRIGPERVDWRYDPILIDSRFPVAYHREWFNDMIRRLSGYTTRCIISFADMYRHLKNRFEEPDETEIHETAKAFADIAGAYDLPLYTCAEAIDLQEYGIRHASCIDRGKIERLIGGPIKAKTDTGQRPSCGCIESVDIGTYNTCANGCVYCYATTSRKMLERQLREHDPQSPKLIGQPSSTDTITLRAVNTLKVDVDKERLKYGLTSDKYVSVS